CFSVFFIALTLDFNNASDNNHLITCSLQVIKKMFNGVSDILDTNNKRRVVVTGLGMVTPLGNSVSETWKGVLDGKSGAADITKFDTAGFPVHFAAEVKGFEPLD